MDTLSTQFRAGRLATELEFAFLAIECAFGTSMAALMTRVSAYTYTQTHAPNAHPDARSDTRKISTNGWMNADVVGMQRIKLPILRFYMAVDGCLATKLSKEEVSFLSKIRSFLSLSHSSLHPSIKVNKEILILIFIIWLLFSPPFSSPSSLLSLSPLFSWTGLMVAVVAVLLGRLAHWQNSWEVQV